MTKAYLFTLFISFWTLSIPTFSQTPIDQFTKAKEFYESGNNKDCIGLLQSVEKQLGANPKIYSLYVKAYLGIPDFTNAAIAFHKFKKLVGTKTSPGIAETLARENEINTGLEKAEQEFLKNGKQNREKEADQIIETNKASNANKLNEIKREFKIYSDNKLSNATLEELWESLAQMTPSMVEKALAPLDKKGITWLDITKELRRVKTIKTEYEINFFPGIKRWDVSTINYKTFNSRGYVTRKDWYSYGFLKCTACPSIEPSSINLSGMETVIKNNKPESYTSDNMQYIALTGNNYQWQQIVDQKGTDGNGVIMRWIRFNENNQLLVDSAENRYIKAPGWYEITRNTYDNESFPLTISTKTMNEFKLSSYLEKTFKRQVSDGISYSYQEIYEEPEKHFKRNISGTRTYNKMGDIISETSKMNEYAPMRNSYKYSYDLYGNVLWKEWKNNQNTIFRVFYLIEYYDGYIPVFHPYEKLQTYSIE